MKIIEKLRLKDENVFHHKAPVIAILGDSMSAGCFEVYTKLDGSMGVTFDPSSAYDVKLREILVKLFPQSSPVIINASRNGERAETAKERVERDILSYNPDLTIVCLGLNDATRGDDYADTFSTSLTEILDKIQGAGAEVIFMTPQLRCIEEFPDVKDSASLAAIKRISQSEQNGDLIKYMDIARELCKERNIPVCDIMRIWEQFRAGGVDINLLLANRINHPMREWHLQFAYELVKTMFS